MLCPRCHDQALIVLDRSGIEIDYCPGCRGVWLDRGELEKLIAREQSSYPAADTSQFRDRKREKYDDDDDDYKRSRSRRRGGFLSELFDFD
jgi:Zn-finger nucleic acid-binding protein